MVSTAAVLSGAAMLVASAAAQDFKLYGINFDLRQGPDWDPNKCKSASTIASELKILSSITKHVRTYALTDCDLKILSSITKHVRTYALTDCDVRPVITNAKSLGLDVWLGVWVSEDEKVFANEVMTLKALIKEGLIDSNIIGFNVGSEAVYRKDISAEQAIKYLSDFKKVLADNNIKVPVAITDIVDVMTQYPDMVTAGDVVTINQFPFWEKMDPAKAAAQFYDRIQPLLTIAAQFYDRIQPLLTIAGNREVIITETGWATDGKNENASDATAAASARYLRDFIQLADKQKWKYYYFQGFDSPWKTKLPGHEDSVEGHFGLYTVDGKIKPAFADTKSIPTNAPDSATTKPSKDGSKAGSKAGSKSGSNKSSKDEAGDDGPGVVKPSDGNSNNNNGGKPNSNGDSGKKPD
ncbi:hypothetical protein P43SY_010081 [Pythium insidiosum]|uniref:glucan endo-1,3-beta-D-glucosidase n=1 Tax=Pythium insidiosum TaxID=114742 RepID=A0AAD5LQH1_PYTIN|nr:hypothetical protein P43SY_010081 [Pythium insidiosum]